MGDRGAWVPVTIFSKFLAQKKRRVSAFCAVLTLDRWTQSYAQPQVPARRALQLAAGIEWRLEYCLIMTSLAAQTPHWKRHRASCCPSNPPMISQLSMKHHQLCTLKLVRRRSSTVLGAEYSRHYPNSRRYVVIICDVLKHSPTD